jgi:hypothetical protein
MDQIRRSKSEMLTRIMIRRQEQATRNATLNEATQPRPRKARRMTSVETGIRDGGVDVLFTDRDEHGDGSESNDGEKASSPNTTRIKLKNKNEGKNPPGKSQQKERKGKTCQCSKVI